MCTFFGYVCDFGLQVGENLENAWLYVKVHQWAKNA